MKEYIVKVFADRTEWYNQNGELHRLNGPAIELADGAKSWWLNGVLHREDGPAIEGADGVKVWCLNGQQLNEEEFNKRMNSCNGKTVVIDGKEYTLKLKN